MDKKENLKKIQAMIPEDLHKMLKFESINNNISLKDLVSKILTEYLENSIR